MYCPQCSQPQLSEEMRFCSRCGFSLSGVKELVAAGGETTSPAPKKRKKRPRVNKRARKPHLTCIRNSLVRDDILS